MKWFILALLLATPTTARTWRVVVDGTGDAPTIQAAIDSAATDGDLILVEPGTYHENIDFLGKEIWLKSTAGPAVTTIDGSATSATTILMSLEPQASPILDGFTITGGNGQWFKCNDLASLPDTSPAIENSAGAALFIIDGTPIIRNNVFRDNHVGGFGGAIIASGCGEPPEDLQIVGNLFINNTSGGNGGAIAISGGINLFLSNNVFKGNSTGPGDGGAVWIINTGSGGRGGATITHNQFWENKAYDHGGAIEISINHTAVTIEHNLFVRNEAQGADHPGDNGSGGAISFRPAFGTVQFNTFIDNQGASNASGGDILISHAMQKTFNISNNIFSGSVGYAIRCSSLHSTASSSGVLLKTNLFWNNDPGQIEDSAMCISDDWLSENHIADPLFCGPEADNFTVSKESPALTNGHLIGAFWNPGCGAGVPVEETTWGTIKALYHTPH